MTEKKKVVVVGAGIGARLLCKALRNNKGLHITIVQPNTFSELPWYCTSEITNKSSFEKNHTVLPVPGSDETVYGVASACGDGVLAATPLKKDEPLKMVPFDVLVCSTGFSFPTVLSTPGQSAEERKAEVDSYTKALTSSDNNVVIAGGGHIGVELAGDVLEERNPNGKGKVTLVCSSDRLLTDRPAEYGAKALAQLETMGCIVLFSERVENMTENVVAPNTVVQLASGKSLECDVYLASYNRGPNTQWLVTPLPEGSNAAALPSSLLNDKKQVEVDKYLASKEYPKLYAIGATNNLGEAGVGMNTENQANTVAANIIEEKSKEHVPGPVKFPIYQLIGHKTYAFVSPDGLQSGGTLIFDWCGFPCNLLCPCFLCGCLCGPLDPMCCGWCCGEPEGMGFPRTLQNFEKMGLTGKLMNYEGLGANAPKEEAMNR